MLPILQISLSQSIISSLLNMAEVGELRLQFTGQLSQEAKKVNSTKETSPNNQKTKKENYKRWLRIALYTLLLLAGQSVGTLLGRLYFDKGGKSKWLAALGLLIGFPILLPLYLIKSPKTPNQNNLIQLKSPTITKLAFVYISLGLLVALDCFLYAVGLMYLPVSTFSLICASQIAFNALFSFFLNSLKFTPFIVNSLVLLTVSSALLVFEPPASDDDGPQEETTFSKRKFITGFICTVAASAGYGLVLSLTQLAFRKVIKKESFKVIMDMIIYQALVSSVILLIGYLGSGEWKDMKREMDEFELGKVSYIMTLVWAAISWQVFSVGSVGLIFEVSSLFSNAISALGLPIIPVFAVVFFHDRMDGVKVMAMILAVWGFVSYGYQNYLDDFKIKVEDVNEDPK